MHDKLALFLGQADLIPGCRRCKDEGPQDQTGGGKSEANESEKATGRWGAIKTRIDDGQLSW